MEENTVPEEQEVVEDLVTEVAEEAVQEQTTDQNDDQSDSPEETKVPLSALQKERRKRQDAEAQLAWVNQNQQQQPQPQPAEEDESDYETTTRKDLKQSRQEAVQETVRIVEENNWIKNNPERYEKLNEQLPEFLKQRPNLASAIDAATNRYEEAWMLMDALTSRQQKALKVVVPKREAPGSPSGVPKAASMNDAVDVMAMSDTEYREWRKSKKSR